MVEWDDPGTPKTAQQADQQNKVGNQNRQATGQAYWQTPAQNGYVGGVVPTSGDPTPEELAGRSNRIGFDSPEYIQARTNAANLSRRYAVENRPGYTPTSQLGDTRTQAAIRAIDMMRVMGMNVASSEVMAGKMLEFQRQQAYGTQTKTDDRYYEGELAKWGENFVEKGSAQHFYLKDTGQVGTNEYEYQADLAVEFLKGRPTKSSEFFSPVSGQMSAYLPGGQGLQQYSWDRAMATARGTTQPGEVSFSSAIERLAGSRGSLFNPTYEGSNRKAGNTPIGAFGGQVSPAWLPSGVAFTGAFGKVEPGKAEEPRAWSFGGVIKDFTQSFEQLKKGDILSGIGLYSQGLSRYSTRAVMPSAQGFGDYIDREQAKSPSPVGTVVAGAAHFGEAVYTDIRKDPVQDVALALLPLGFKAAELGITNTIARGAMSGSKVFSVPGRALSTPAAKTVSSLFKVGLAGVYAYQSGSNVMAAPDTAKGKGTALGHVGYQVGMMGLGLPLAAQYTPTMRANTFDSRTFFSKERKLPMSERAMIRAGDFVTGLTKTKGQRIAVKAISAEYNKNLFTKPEITTVEPNYAELTHVGPKNAAAVKAAMVDQVSVGYGSGMMDAQVGKTPMGAVLRKTALPSSDVDVFAEFPKIMETKAGKAAIGMDVHAFPEGYPNVGQGSNAPVDAGSYLFGARYRVNPYIDEITVAGKTEGYTGKTSFEHLNVQFRKLSSAVRDDVLDPMNSGYRLGKDVSRLTRVRDVLAEIKGTKDSAFDTMLKQEITYNAQVGKTGKPNIITETLGEARARYEGSPKQNIPDVFSRYSKGAVSSMISSIAPGSVMASLGKVSASSFISKVSSPSYRPSSPVSSIASRIPYSPSLTPYRTPTSIIGSPPSGPLFSGISIPKSPPSSIPRSPPSSTPYTPPATPPSSPRSPPSSTPYTPPYVPPYTPPPSVPVIGSMPPFGGGGGGSPFGQRVSSPWSRRNLVGAELFMNKKKKGRSFRPPF
jgi:hypothetical protein